MFSNTTDHLTDLPTLTAFEKCTANLHDYTSTEQLNNWWYVTICLNILLISPVKFKHNIYSKLYYLYLGLSSVIPNYPLLLLPLHSKLCYISQIPTVSD